MVVYVFLSGRLMCCDMGEGCFQIIKIPVPVKLLIYSLLKIMIRPLKKIIKKGEM